MPAGSRKQIENGMSSMTARKRDKAMILPQFPFLFPSALVCFLFPVSRCWKLETKAVSWAVSPMRMLGNDRETKGPQTGLCFSIVRGPQFRFLFPLNALGAE